MIFVMNRKKGNDIIMLKRKTCSDLCFESD